MKTIHITAYKFVVLTQLEHLRNSLMSECQRLHLLGTILLSQEGINVNLAGKRDAVECLKSFFSQYQLLREIQFKETYCDSQPYDRLLVKIKPEIITFQQPEIEPALQTAKHLSPDLFKQWLDEHEDIVVIDARNDYEVEHGTFAGAIDLKIQQFIDFPQAISQLGEQYKNKRVVIFCTGGVRCEKAGLLMDNLGYQELYQLEGGIINYFAHCGTAHYNGECFVFDSRVSINADACCHPTDTI